MIYVEEEDDCKNLYYSCVFEYIHASSFSPRAGSFVMTQFVTPALGSFGTPDYQVPWTPVCSCVVRRRSCARAVRTATTARDKDILQETQERGPEKRTFFRTKSVPVTGMDVCTACPNIAKTIPPEKQVQKRGQYF